MSELVSEFGQNFPELNRALKDFKVDMTTASVELFDQKLATTNQTYEIENNGDSFTIKGTEFLLNTIDFANFDSLNDAVETFVDDIMVTDPDGEVIIPILFGINGMSFLYLVSNKPSISNFLRSSSLILRSCPSPCTDIESTSI